MPPVVPSRNSTRASKLHALLDDLGEQLQRGSQLKPKAPPPIAAAATSIRQQHEQPDADFCPSGSSPSGLDEIDDLLGGGFPVGYLSEVTGPTSSGRTSLLLALLARTTRSGACVAVIDRADAFDPPSAAARGVVLDRVLWVRAKDWRSALRSTECLLETDGFPLVVLDWTGVREAQIPEAAWLRLTRLAARQQSALLLLSNERIAGSRAAVVLEMQPAVGRFSASPSLLEELETHAVLIRHRVHSARKPSPDSRQDSGAAA